MFEDTSSLGRGLTDDLGEQLFMLSGYDVILSPIKMPLTSWLKGTCRSQEGHREGHKAQ